MEIYVRTSYLFYTFIQIISYLLIKFIILFNNKGYI